MLLPCVFPLALTLFSEFVTSSLLVAPTQPHNNEPFHHLAPSSSSVLSPSVLPRPGSAGIGLRYVSQSHSLKSIASKRAILQTLFIIMQHRSLTRTREWGPNTPASLKSPVRYHSPYCEATGPIVQDGFVASRIRTLQALSNHEFKPIRSHSPMLKCPQPWQHNQGHDTPPTPGSPAKSSMGGHDGPKCETNNEDCGNALSNRSQEQCNQFSVQMMSRSDAVPPQRLIDFRLQAHQDHTPIELPEPSAPRSPHGDAVAIEDSTTIGRRTPSEDGILSPRALPASLAEPSKAWRDNSQTGSYDNDNSHNQNLRPRRSIADRLGSMVERGWVGCDVFGKARNSREVSESIAGESTHKERVKRRSRSLEQHQQRTRPLLLKRHRSFSNSRVTANAQKSSIERISDENSDNRYPLGKYTPPTPVQDAMRGINVRKRGAQRSSSDAELYREENRASSSSGRHRMWSLRHFSRLQRSQSQQFELEPISSGHGSSQGHRKQDRKTIDHFLSSGNTKREQKQEPQALPDDQQDQGSETTSLTPSSSRASIATAHSARSATRSGSWFKKYRFLPKLVPTDNSLVLWNFSNEDPNGSAAIRATGDSQQDSPVQSDQHDADHNKTCSLPRHGFEEADSKPDASLMDPGMTAKAEAMPQNGSPRSIELRITTSPQGSESSLMSEQMKTLIEPPTISCPLFADAKSPLRDQEHYPPNQVDYFSKHGEYPLLPPLLTQSKHSSMSRGTNATLATVVSCKTNGEEVTRHSPMGSQASMPTAQTKLRLEKSLDLISLALSHGTTPTRGSPTTSPQRLDSDVIELPLEHSTDPTQSSPQVDEATQTVGRGRRASEKRIKKIQVTITLDGAEELVIEAKLQRRAGWEGWGMSNE